MTSPSTDPFAFANTRRSSTEGPGTPGTPVDELRATLEIFFDNDNSTQGSPQLTTTTNGGSSNNSPAAGLGGTGTVLSPTGATVAVANPNDPNSIGLTQRIQQGIMNLNEDQRPDNTKIAMDPKVEEYNQFCACKFHHEDYPRAVTHEKCYLFMTYTAFRMKRNVATIPDPKRPGKLKRKKHTKGVFFDPVEFEEIMSTHGTTGVSNYPLPRFPIALDCFDQYKAAVKGVHSKQAYKKTNGTPWEMIWTEPCKVLAKHAKERKAIIKKLTYQEKVDAETSSYTIVERYEEIEKELWVDSTASKNKRSIATALRHRAVFLYLTSGVLRCESLYRSEISDMLAVNPPKQDADVHQPYVMVTQLPIGKTNHGKKLYGRATRHKDVRLSAVGSMSFYLQFRIYVTGEFVNMTTEDWMENEAWYDIKLLVDVQTKNNKLEMTNDSCGKKITETLKRLKMVCNKILHLGRNVGHRLLELLEEEAEEVRRMGQWNPNVRDAHYSAKLPMGPIRKLAGYKNNNKMYFNTRTSVVVPMELMKMAPLGFAHEALDKLIEKGVASDHPTSTATLLFFQEMNKVFFQDAARLMLIDEGDDERHYHPMFDEMAVFKSDLFKGFKEKMKLAIDNEECPLDANLEKVIPGLHQWHHENHTALVLLDLKVSRENLALSQAIKEGNRVLQEAISQERHDREESLYKLFTELASALGPKRRRTSENSSVAQGSRDEDEAIQAFQRSLARLKDSNDSNSNRSNANDNEDDKPWLADVHANFRLASKHDSLLDLCHEWHGLGKYADEDWKGVAGREEKFGKKWRKHLNSNQFSRTSRTILGIQEKQRLMEVDDPAIACAEVDPAFQEVGCSVAKFVLCLQQQQLLPKGKPRGKRKDLNLTE